MRWFKKIVRAFLALLPMFAIFLIPSNVSALSYPINSLPFTPSTYEFRKVKTANNQSFYAYFEKSNFFQIIVPYVPQGFQFPRTWRFTGDYDSSSNTCSLPINRSDYYSDGVSVTSLNGGSTSYQLSSPIDVTVFRDSNLFDGFNSPFSTNSFFGLQTSSFDDTQFCDILGNSYNDTSITSNPNPAYDWSSLINIPLVNNRKEYEASKPYTYQFDRITLNGMTRNDSGVVYEHNGLKLSKIFGVRVPYINSMSFSFDDFTDADVYLSPDDYSDGCSTSCDLLERVYNFELRGSLVFSSSFTLGSDSGFELVVRNYNADNFTKSFYSTFTINNNPVYDLDYVESSISCSHTVSNDRIDFVCPYNPSTENAFSSEVNFRFLDWYLTFDNDINDPGLSSSNVFLATDGDITLTDFYIVTNGDDTPSGWSGSPSGEGGTPDVAPGAIGSGGTANWYNSLLSLFGFSFINPFAPLFNMFSNNESCASIPTIASMLHSNETEVCPWFNSTTRNIVTPVLGLASAMLVFGFAVRWLGSSSGNLFEDSKHETVNSSGRHKK